jgi:ABC-2 type transport system ATP-binding protein/lipopolysaccharide transport system ATP-binding protein
MRLVRADILIMDEWINAADASVNETANTLQAELIGQSSILILASHSQRVLSEWTEKLIWLDQGEVRAMGTVQEVFPEYQKWTGKRK